MSLDTGRARLFTSWKIIKQRWEDTRMYWNDSVREKFEKEYVNALEYHVVAELSAIDRLAQIMNQAKQESD